MSDLISRSELIKVLKDRATNEAIMGYMTAYYVTNSIIDEVEEQPTAYSVDKVISQLEDYGNEEMDYYQGTPYENCIRECVSNAIEIVQQGGVSDDVCEWRLCDEEANVYDTSCRNPHILIE